MSDIFYNRVVREHDDRNYRRKPAKGDLILNLEKIINESDLLVIEFDGYIIPKDGSRVTLLLYCREFKRELLKYETTDLARILFNEIQQKVDFDLAVKLSHKFNCHLACVFPPYDYPIDDDEAKESKIIVFPKIEEDRILREMNVKKIKEFLLNHNKRYTTKSLTFAATKLEYYLSQIPSGTNNTIAFPGDADGILMDSNKNVLAILEYKSDTYGKKIIDESISKYKSDITRFNVLDDFCKLLDVPLVIIFWSDTHTKSKIVLRDSFSGEETSTILSSDSYDDLALQIFKLLKDIHKK